MHLSHPHKRLNTSWSLSIVPTISTQHSLRSTTLKPSGENGLKPLYLYMVSHNQVALVVDESNKISILKTIGASLCLTHVDSCKLARGMEQVNKYLNMR